MSKLRVRGLFFVFFIFLNYTFASFSLVEVCVCLRGRPLTYYVINALRLDKMLACEAGKPSSAGQPPKSVQKENNNNLHPLFIFVRGMRETAGGEGAMSGC